MKIDPTDKAYIAAQNDLDQKVKKIEARAAELMRNDVRLEWDAAILKAQWELNAEEPPERLPGFTPVYHMPGYQPPEPPALRLATSNVAAIKPVDDTVLIYCKDGRLFEIDKRVIRAAGYYAPPAFEVWDERHDAILQEIKGKGGKTDNPRLKPLIQELVEINDLRTRTSKPTTLGIGRICSSWVWEDSPSNPPSGFDSDSVVSPPGEGVV